MLGIRCGQRGAGRGALELAAAGSAGVRESGRAGRGAACAAVPVTQDDIFSCMRSEAGVSARSDSCCASQPAAQGPRRHAPPRAAGVSPSRASRSAARLGWLGYARLRYANAVSSSLACFALLPVPGPRCVVLPRALRHALRCGDTPRQRAPL